jgi:hypothetical protein
MALGISRSEFILLQAGPAAALCIFVSASLPRPVTAATGPTSVTQSTPTPTATPRPLLIAIDNIVATGSTQFSTDFDSFALGTLAEDLTVSGMTFTPDPPGTWQIGQSRTIFQIPLQTLVGNVLYQPSTPGTLIIAFATPISSFSCSFAEDQPPGASSLTVQAYTGTTLVGSASRVTTTGNLIGEGAIDLTSATPFNKVRLSGDYAVLPTPTPTPHSPAGNLNPTGIPNTEPDTGTGLSVGSRGSSCSITDQGSRWAVALLMGVPFLMRFARDRRQIGIFHWITGSISACLHHKAPVHSLVCCTMNGAHMLTGASASPCLLALVASRNSAIVFNCALCRACATDSPRVAPSGSRAPSPSHAQPG